MASGHIKTFGRKKEADAYHATIAVEVRQGIHTPGEQQYHGRNSADDWINFVELESRERATVVQYRAHVRHHFGGRLNELTVARWR